MVFFSTEFTKVKDDLKTKYILLVQYFTKILHLFEFIVEKELCGLITHAAAYRQHSIPVCVTAENK